MSSREAIKKRKRRINRSVIGKNKEGRPKSIVAIKKRMKSGKESKEKDLTAKSPPDQEDHQCDPKVRRKTVRGKKKIT